MFIGSGGLNDQMSIGCELIDAGQVFADEQVSRIRPLYVMGHRMRCFIQVVAAE
jgi:hypothetical protein